MEKFYIGIGGQLADEDIKKLGHQTLFLLNLVEVIPETMEEIHNLYLSFEKTVISLGKKPNMALDFSTFNETNAIETFKNELREWATIRYINEEWLIEKIFLTYMIWFEDENTKYSLKISNPAVGETQKISAKIQSDGNYYLPVFNPITMTEVDYKKFVERLVINYIQNTKSVFEEKGYIAADEKRTNQHYHWFICFHILGWSVEDIAVNFSDDYYTTGGVNVDNIRKEIRKIYKYIDLNRKKRNKNKK